MRVVCIADTHGIRHDKDLPDGDILIHAGDLSLIGEVYEIQSALAWLRKFPHRFKIFIGGNHDNALAELPVLFEEQMKPYKGYTALIHLRGSMIHIAGTTVFGSPVLPFSDVFRAGARAYMLDGTTERHWKNAGTCDILITHGPPKGILDGGFGDPHLRAYVDRIKPKLHVFGHVHTDPGVVQENGTTFVNATQLNMSYRPANDPVVIDI